MASAPKSPAGQFGPGIAVGVSGHRFLAEPDRLIAGIDRAIDRVETVLGRPLTVLSSLAEGADRLVAGRILGRPAARLTAVLPLPAKDYLDDFESSGSKQEFR